MWTCPVLLECCTEYFHLCKKIWSSTLTCFCGKVGLFFLGHLQFVCLLYIINLACCSLHQAILLLRLFVTHLTQSVQTQDTLGWSSPLLRLIWGHSFHLHSHCPFLPTPCDPWWRRVRLDRRNEGSESSRGEVCAPQVRGTHTKVTHSDGFPMMLDHS